MPAKVADASVIAAIAFNESRADEAWSLIVGADLYEPTILRYELTSVARKKVIHEQQSKDAVGMALLRALRMQIRLLEVTFLDVFELSLENGLSTYDASYLYIARALDIPLETFDRQLRRAI